MDRTYMISSHITSTKSIQALLAYVPNSAWLIRTQIMMPNADTLQAVFMPQYHGYDYTISSKIISNGSFYCDYNQKITDKLNMGGEFSCGQGMSSIVLGGQYKWNKGKSYIAPIVDVASNTCNIMYSRELAKKLRLSADLELGQDQTKSYYSKMSLSARCKFKNAICEIYGDSNGTIQVSTDNYVTFKDVLILQAVLNPFRNVFKLGISYKSDLF